MIPKSHSELVHDLALMDERLKNLEHRFTNYEHRTLPHLQEIVKEVIIRQCPNPECDATIMDKQGSRISCGMCGYQNWLD